jgi:hypothetical protein
MMRRVSSLMLVAALTAPLLFAGSAMAGSREVKLKLPLRPKLAVSGRERISLAPFIVATQLSVS